MVLRYDGIWGDFVGLNAPPWDMMRPGDPVHCAET